MSYRWNQATRAGRLEAAMPHTRSKMPAAPWPMPTHIVTMPYFQLVAAQRVHHGGRADRAGGAQRVAQRDRAAHRVDLGRVQAQVLITASDCAAKASFSSIQPMSSWLRPA
jgi:hypothetical protein